MRQILISTEKIGTSAGRIDQLDFGDSRTGKGADEGDAAVIPAGLRLELEAGE
jgi:hypothetical protein